VKSKTKGQEKVIVQVPIIVMPIAFNSAITIYINAALIKKPRPNPTRRPKITNNILTTSLSFDNVIITYPKEKVNNYF
jgi:hypothetical protein